MKLKTIYISAFGKLQDFRYDFNDQLNTIEQSNGWGKSTLATFIKAMFYGLNDSKRKVSENERIRFKPWNYSGAFGGYVQFEWGGKEYKIERFFGDKESQDTVKLFDVATGKEYANTDNLGNRIFEIDEEGFLSTTYFSQKDFQIKSNSSLTAKYNAICEVDDSKYFDNAVVKLENRIKELKLSRGDRGLIPDTKKNIAYLDGEIERVSAFNNNLVKIEQDARVLEEETIKINNQTESLAKEMSAVVDKERLINKKADYEKLREKERILSKQKASCEKILNGNQVSANELQLYRECVSDIKIAKSRVGDLEKDLLSLEQVVESEPKAKNTNYNFLLILSIILTLGGIVGLFFNTMIGSIITTVGAVALIGTILAIKKSKNKPITDDKYSTLREQKRVELLEYQRIVLEYTAKLEEFIGKFNLNSNTDYEQTLLNIQNVLYEKQRLEKEEASVFNELKPLIAEKEKFENLATTATNIDSLKERLNRLQTEYSLKSDALAKRKALVKGYKDELATLSDLESSRAEQVEKYNSYVSEYKIVTKTLDFIMQADENLKTKYRAPLENSLNRYLSLIIGQDINANIDIDLSVLIEEKGGTKSTEYYSKGYQNLFEICKRFALTDVLFKREKPFIILDDPFYNLDEEKISASLKLIKELSKEYQILYLICHPSRSALNEI